MPIKIITKTNNKLPQKENVQNSELEKILVISIEKRELNSYSGKHQRKHQI